MSWLARFASRLAPRAAADGGATVTVEQVARALRAGGETLSGVAVGPENALKTSTFFRCVTMISGVMATLPLDIKDGPDVLPGHPIIGLLRRRPNPAAKMNSGQFRRMMQSWVLMHGNAYAQIVRSGRRVAALIPIHPYRVHQKLLNTGETVYDVTRTEGGTVRIAQADMFHLFGLTLDGQKGVSILEYARESVGDSLAAGQFASGLFRNGTHMGGVVMTDKVLGEAARNNLRASFEEYRGAHNAGKFLFLEQGTKIEKLGMTLADAQFIQNKEVTATDICMFFGVPPHMVGLTSKQTSWGTGIEQQSIGFVNYTVADHGEMWQSAVETQLLDAEPGLTARFDYKGLLRGDHAARAAYHKAMFECGAESPNDIRDVEDLGAPYEGGDRYFTPLNFTTDPAAAEIVSAAPAASAASAGQNP